MAGGMDLGSSGKGGKKALDAAINLVPFIDLMAVTIVFLIMTAVWTQLGRLQVSNAGQSGEPPDQQLADKQPLALLITEKEIRITVGGAPVGEPIPIRHDIINVKGNTERSAVKRIDLSKLAPQLADLKKARGDDPAITLQTEDGVRYDDLVRIIDTTVPYFSVVSVSPASQ